MGGERESGGLKIRSVENRIAKVNAVSEVVVVGCNHCSIPCIPQGGVEGVWEGQLAVIARTNAVLFDSMVHLCYQNETYKFGFAGVSMKREASLFK